MGEDATTEVSGFQVELVSGRGSIELEPAARPFQLQLHAAWGSLETAERLQVLGTQSTLYQGQVSVTARVTGGFACTRPGLPRNPARWRHPAGSS